MNLIGHLRGSQRLLNPDIRRWILNVIVSLLVFLFVYAAMTKMMAMDQFRVQIGQSPLLTRWSGMLSWVVPGVELLVSVILCYRPTRVAGLFVSFGLMVMFTTYIIVVMNFSPFVPCSCGGVLEDMTWGQHLVFNVVFVVLALVGIVLSAKEEEVYT